MPAQRPAPRVIDGTYIRLFPLKKSDLPELFAAIGRPETYAGGWGGGPEGYRGNRADFIAFGQTYFQWNEGNVYGARLIGGGHDGALIGTSTLSEFDETKESVQIGWTAWDSRTWATAVNPEAKLLLLREAFDSGFGRVRIQTDVLNERSRAAVAKLGATFEGVTRRERLRADGSWRDSAVYSILIDEWPGVQSALESRLAAFGGQPVEIRVL